MLIAPIFKVDYLSKQTEPHNSKIKDVTTNVQIKNGNNPTPNSTYNIFKTALNRGTELIKSTFLSKSTNFYNDSFELNANVEGQTSLSAKLQTSNNVERSSSESSTSSSSSSSSSDHSSSPDSIKTELMLFKPIVREPRTSLSTKVLRVPSIRSTSSSSTIHTPSPSPFFIPTTLQRQSAFSLVIHSYDKDPKKPKNVKRKHSKCESKKSEELSPKRQKVDIKKVDKDSSNSKLKTESMKATRSTVKARNQSIKQVLTKQKGKDIKSKARLDRSDDFRRVTRSMKKT